MPATGEILWDLEKPVYVEMTSRCDSVLLARGESITGWVLTEAEITNPGEGWMSPFSVPEEGMSEGHPEGAASGSLLCSRVLLHLAATPRQPHDLCVAAPSMRRCRADGRRASLAPAAHLGLMMRRLMMRDGVRWP